MRKTPVDLSIVVPCFNEEEAIPVFFSTTEQVVAEMGVTCEYVFVDDGSSDGTLKLLRAMG